jgi:hypothetical protein
MVKRYDQHDRHEPIEEMANGEYVKHTDYDDLAERCERLEGALRGVIAEADRDTAPFIAARELLSQVTNV